MPDESVTVKRLPQSLLFLRDDVFRRELRQAISATSRPAIIFDLPAAVRLDGPVIECLIRYAHEAVEHDAEVALVVANPEHRVLLEVTRLSRVLPVFGSTEEAVAFLGRSRKSLPNQIAETTTGTPAQRAR